MMFGSKRFWLICAAVCSMLFLVTVGVAVAGDEQCEICKKTADGSDLECKPISTWQDSHDGRVDCEVTGSCYTFLGQTYCVRKCGGTPGSCIQSLG